jgi:tRNA-binding EMAP/Myf-like protein
MRGEISEGMILCAEDNKDIIFISPERKIKNGSEVH